ncbi:hypothetical protein M9H77_35192 [Catharanthus roseus]|uniref:Uncharacterized protein n=1 Tax=Catharanthus roseus TaxID=4058 RepID=A0ACB9ZSK6_CATRO|nr:hypothetical protein M9H77_35192 [Catharanthus roseus]
MYSIRIVFIGTKYKRLQNLEEMCFIIKELEPNHGRSVRKGRGRRIYTKVDIRTDCKAMIEFRLNDVSGCTVTKHNDSHNHGLCVVSQRHFMRSQRGVTKNNAGYLQELKDSGVSIATGLMVSKKQVVERSGVQLLVRISSLEVLYHLKGVTQLTTIFDEVISEWRSNTNMEEFRCNQWHVEMKGVGDSEKVNKKDIAGSKNEGGSSNIKDPVGRHAKGEYNVRKKSIVEIKCNQAKGKRKSALMHKN